MKTVICIATRNPNKVREISAILDLPSEFSVTDLTAFPHMDDIPENGSTYTENAVIKAETTAKLTGNISIADDSGLSIDYLDGFPGVHSARYLGDNATDVDRCNDILKKMKKVRDPERTARFVCAAALALPTGGTIVMEKSVEGTIAHEPAGNYGFGYDPIFYVPQFGKVMAELSPEQKNSISHRALAFRALLPHIINIHRD